MFIVRIEHPVPDFAAWKRVFDADPLGRERAGVRRYRILRPVNDSKQVYVDLEFDDRARADEMQAALERTWGNVQGKLIGTPRATVVEVSEQKDY